MNRQKERVVRMENQKKYIAFRRAYPVFYYHGFSLSQEGDALCVRYDLKLKIFAASALRCGLIQRRSKSKTHRIRRPRSGCSSALAW